MVAIDLHNRMLVSTPEWEDGQPVRILHTHPALEGVAVRYQDVHAHHHAHDVVVAPGFHLDLISGGHGRAA